MTRWLETDSGSNVNISAATEIGSYTADADRMVMAQMFVDQVAGNGDYVLYATLQVGGSGSTYRLIPITTANAASGVTAIGAVSAWIPVRSGDVVKVYVDGLAGDTSTPDPVVRWFELAALRPATADRTVAVDASGYVTATNSIPSAATNASAVRTELATELGRIDAAISSRLATAGYSAAPTAGDVADAVWDEALAGHVAVGSAGAALGDATDSLANIETQLAGSAASIAASLSDNDVTIFRGDTWSAAIADLGNVAGRTKLYWTIKADSRDADADAVVQVEETAGLVRLNGATGTAGNGDITVTDATTGDVTLTLAAAATAALTPGTYIYDIQMVTAAGVTTLGTGMATVTADVTRATS